MIPNYSLTIWEMFIAIDKVNNWYKLGLELGLSKSVLNDIKISNPFSPKRCKLETLTSWTRRDPNPSWEKLINVLKMMEEVRTVTDICQQRNMGKNDLLQHMLNY